MKKYLIYGLSGSGKSTVEKVLKQRGYHTVETDFEPNLSKWINKKTGNPVPEPEPPYEARWLKEHVWNWDKKQLLKLLSGDEHEAIFLCGGANNLDEFYNHFDQIFALTVDSQTMKQRLQSREPERWADNSPELNRMLQWNRDFKKDRGHPGVIFIDATQPIEKVVGDILSRIDEESSLA